MKLVHTAQASSSTPNNFELPESMIVFSHLRWDFVYQRPQHLLARFGKQFNITFIEEPIFDSPDKAYYSFTQREESIIVMTPHMPADLSAEDIRDVLKALFNEYMENKMLANYTFWYYTPMALEFSRKHSPRLVVYDCMDELSAFKFAPARLKVLEQELLKISDVVFTGGRSLYEAKKHQHANIYPFASSIDAGHFHTVRALAASRQDIPAGQAGVTLGFYGVIDERFDIDMIKQIADARPNWNIILIGPVVKIDEGTLPRNKNISYLGPKSYQLLPVYMAAWDIALIPFLLNESTRFISPTKTPEYLAAGLPVISTAIKDVVNPYGIKKLVQIGNNAHDFIQAAESCLSLSPKERAEWLSKADQFLELNSWDKTCAHMLATIKNVLTHKVRTELMKII